MLLTKPALTWLFPVFGPRFFHLLPHLGFVLVILLLLSLSRYLNQQKFWQLSTNNFDEPDIHLIFMSHPLPFKVCKELHDHDGDGLLEVDGVVLVHDHWLPRNSQFPLLLLNLLLHPSCSQRGVIFELWSRIRTYPWPPQQSPYKQPWSLSLPGQSCIQRKGYQAHHHVGQVGLLPGPLYCVERHLGALLVVRVLVWMNLIRKFTFRVQLDVSGPLTIIDILRNFFFASSTDASGSICRTSNGLRFLRKVWAINQCEPNFQDCLLNWWRKELFRSTRTS